MKKNKFTETDLSMYVNNATFIDYLNRLQLIAISMFKWNGLDEICGIGAERFLEQTLYNKGRACFIKDDKLGYMVCNANPSDTLNTYNLPTKINAWSITYNKNYKLEDCVYIMNNELTIPTMKTIELFSYRLYETERTIDINLHAQKTPVLLEGEQKSMLTLKNLYMQYSGNTPFIFGNKNFNINDKVNCIKTDAPYLIDKLEIHKHEIWNDALTYLGINNANTDKKERLITDEVNSNDELIKFYLNCFYKTRKKACDEINNKFNLNIKITLNDDIKKLFDLSNEEIDYILNGESGEENE